MARLSPAALTRIETMILEGRTDTDIVHEVQDAGLTGAGKATILQFIDRARERLGTEDPQPREKPAPEREEAGDVAEPGPEEPEEEELPDQVTLTLTGPWGAFRVTTCEETEEVEVFFEAIVSTELADELAGRILREFYPLPE